MISSIEREEIEAQIEFLCIDAMSLWRDKLGHLAREYHLSRLERRILMFVGRNSFIHQAYLASLMDIEPQSLTRAIDGMEKKSWILKEKDTKDKRIKYLNLTQKGEKIFENVLKISEKIRPRILENISLDQKNSLILILNLMTKNLKDMKGTI